MNNALASGQITEAQYRAYYFGNSNYADNTVNDNLGNSGIPVIDACQNNYEGCVVPTASILFWLWVLFFILASLPSTRCAAARAVRKSTTTLPMSRCRRPRMLPGRRSPCTTRLTMRHTAPQRATTAKGDTRQVET